MQMGAAFRDPMAVFPVPGSSVVAKTKDNFRSSEEMK
jgi:hypothetical protein